MKGLNSEGAGTGVPIMGPHYGSPLRVPGGLDKMGFESAKLFLPGHKLTQSELNFELSKLSSNYFRRK